MLNTKLKVAVATLIGVIVVAVVASLATLTVTADDGGPEPEEPVPEWVGACDRLDDMNTDVELGVESLDDEAFVDEFAETIELCGTEMVETMRVDAHRLTPEQFEAEYGFPPTEELLQDPPVDVGD